MWDFKGRRGDVYFLLYFCCLTFFICNYDVFLFMNKNIKFFLKNLVECSCPEAAAISGGCLPLPLFIFFIPGGAKGTSVFSTALLTRALNLTCHSL